MIIKNPDGTITDTSKSNNGASPVSAAPGQIPIVLQAPQQPQQGGAAGGSMGTVVGGGEGLPLFALMTEPVVPAPAAAQQATTGPTLPPPPFQMVNVEPSAYMQQQVLNTTLPTTTNNTTISSVNPQPKLSGSSTSSPNASQSTQGVSGGLSGHGSPAGLVMSAEQTLLEVPPVPFPTPMQPNTSSPNPPGAFVLTPMTTPNASLTNNPQQQQQTRQAGGSTSQGSYGSSIQGQMLAQFRPNPAGPIMLPNFPPQPLPPTTAGSSMNSAFSTSGGASGAGGTAVAGKRIILGSGGDSMTKSTAAEAAKNFNPLSQVPTPMMKSENSGSKEGGEGSGAASSTTAGEGGEVKPVGKLRDPNDKGPKQLIVKFLAPQVTEQELRALFQQFGPVEYSRMIYDSATGASKGYGFVYYYRSADAADAVSGLESFELYGRYLRVGFAIPQRQPPQPGPGGK